MFTSAFNCDFLGKTVVLMKIQICSLFIH